MILRRARCTHEPPPTNARRYRVHRSIGLQMARSRSSQPHQHHVSTTPAPRPPRTTTLPVANTEDLRRLTLHPSSEVTKAASRSNNFTDIVVSPEQIRQLAALVGGRANPACQRGRDRPTAPLLRAGAASPSASTRCRLEEPLAPEVLRVLEPRWKRPANRQTGYRK